MSAFWLLIFGLAFTSFLPRASFLVFFARWPVPDTLRRALRYVPAAVFSAIIAPALVLNEGVLQLAPANPRLAAGLFAAVIAWRWRNTLLTIGSGMLALHLFSHLAQRA